MELKKLIYGTTIVSALLLGACADEGEPTNESTVEEAAVEETTEGTTEEETSNELNQVIADDENVKAILISVKEATDTNGETIYEAVFEVENRLAEQIDVGYAAISGDGEQLAAGQSGMTATLIEPGATGQAMLRFYNKDGKGFPKNVDMSLAISKVNPDTPGTLASVKDYPLSLTLPVDETVAEGMNILIVDNESVKASIIGVTETTDPSKGKVFEVLFEIENRLTDNVVTPGHYDVVVNGQKLSSNQATITDANIKPQSTGQATLNLYGDQEPTIAELNSLVMMLTIDKRIEGETMLQPVGDFPVDVTF